MEYLKRTWKNKLAAVGLIIIGLLALYLDNDITVLVLCSIFAFPLVIAKESCFYERDEEDDDNV